MSPQRSPLRNARKVSFMNYFDRLRPILSQQPWVAEVERDEDFWFPKGDFIIIANQSKAFRIHGDIVARKSNVFSDLFSLAETPRPDSEDTMDGCPVVHVTDAPVDFWIFLGLIHDGFQYASFRLFNDAWTLTRTQTP